MARRLEPDDPHECDSCHKIWRTDELVKGKGGRYLSLVCPECSGYVNDPGARTALFNASRRVRASKERKV